ncbi:hypothetical protein [Actinacidiphila sp. ITFR-21]|uniref:hypothetical protein n=1 Tax=Actinacidiphila sp. ITFR-21 TaxID=3075199 RepID=UPI00288B6348|nr:hypothetical protein [Streptomyces sp. ITFR-21]WNI20326.1 hypothetical protein RLT57_33195 [Streptomyces sp. ITFR-21]
MLGPGGLLDWRDARHHSAEARPCRYCGSSTHMRDETGKPADKVCAERVYAEILQVAAAAHIQQGTL